jgi:hypothetical protein
MMMLCGGQNRMEHEHTPSLFQVFRMICHSLFFSNDSVNTLSQVTDVTVIDGMNALLREMCALFAICPSVFVLDFQWSARSESK